MLGTLLPSGIASETNAHAVQLSSNSAGLKPDATLLTKLTNDIENSSIPREDKKAVSEALEKILTSNSSHLSNQQKIDFANSLVTDILHPEKINQGVHCTCTVTSATYLMLGCEKQYAEYARVMSDLATEGKAKLKGGAEIKLPTEALGKDSLTVTPPYEARSITERVFQTALMKMALDPKYDYNADNDTWNGSYAGYAANNYQGLFPLQYRHVTEQLLGKGISLVDLESHGDIKSVLRQENSKKNFPALAEIRWGDVGGSQHQLHIVVIKEVRGNEVILYNPHGKTPPQSNTAEFSMSMDEFKNRATKVLVNDGTKPQGLQEPEHVAVVEQIVNNSEHSTIEGNTVIKLQSSTKPIEEIKSAGAEKNSHHISSIIKAQVPITGQTHAGFEDKTAQAYQASKTVAGRNTANKGHSHLKSPHSLDSDDDL